MRNTVISILAYPNDDYSVWFDSSGQSTSLSESNTNYDQIRILDLYMRMKYRNTSDTYHQFGVVFSGDGIDYRYPLQYFLP